jgi:hypothetical protein
MLENITRSAGSRALTLQPRYARRATRERACRGSDEPLEGTEMAGNRGVESGFYVVLRQIDQSDGGGAVDSLTRNSALSLMKPSSL